MGRFIVISTHYKDSPEHATIPWAVADAALVEDHEVIMFLQGPAVQSARKGGAEGLVFPPFAPIKDLMNAFLEAGGEIQVCGPCMQGYQMAEGDLIEGARPAGAALLVEEADKATILTY